jgi:hypothetical protein
MQTTATNNATYLVNRRRRVFRSGASVGACCRTPSPAGACRTPEKYLVISCIFIGTNVPAPSTCRPVSKCASSDHLVGTGDECRWDLEPKGLRSLEIYRQLKVRRLFNWKLAGLGAFENAVDIGGGTVE